jgi:hypothetical protein
VPPCSDPPGLGHTWLKPTVVFSLSRWGSRMTDGEIVDRVLADLAAPLPDPDLYRPAVGGPIFPEAGEDPASMLVVYARVMPVMLPCVGSERPLQRECGPKERPLQRECGPEERPLQRECGPAEGERPLRRECGPRGRLLGTAGKHEGALCNERPLQDECGPQDRTENIMKLRPGEAARNHLQRRLLGHVTRVILSTQDALGAICGSLSWGELTKETRTACLQVNEALRPWVLAWMGLTDTTLARRTFAVWRSHYPKGLVDTEHTVYLRFNLHNGDTYVGKTSFYTARFYQHYKQVSRHRSGSCKGCKEHAKYTRQADLKPTQWITVPIATTGTEGEAYSLERWLIRYLRPSLNSGDKPFWWRRWKESRDTEYRSRHRTRPRRGKGRDAGERNVPVQHTRYLDNQGNSWFDLRGLMETQCTTNQDIRLQVQPGAVDLTNWRLLKREYPMSFCRTNATGAVCLKEWDHTQTSSNGETFTLFLIPRRRPDDVGQGSGLFLDIGLPSHLYFPEDREEFQELIEGASKEEFEGIWQQRNYYERHVRRGGRAQIWTECERRFSKFSRKPIQLKVPQAFDLDITTFKKQIRLLLIEGTCWPHFLVEWHMRNLHIARTGMPSIADIMINVNKPWRPSGRCACNDVMKQLRGHGSGWCPPTMKGHIFFTGREYAGPGRACLNMSNVNVPAPTQWDLRRVWERVLDQIPVPKLPHTLVEDLACTHFHRQKPGKWMGLEQWPTTRDVYNTRRTLEGLVTGPLDKNNGELWCCCPCLYEEALEKMYCMATGYTEVVPRKLTSYQVRKHSRGQVHKYVLGTDGPMRDNQRGNVSDVTRAWRMLYKTKGWERFGKFDSKGGFNTPYILFKAKNVCDPATRAEKGLKTRPIAPGTRHPMSSMLGKAGRAWNFIATDAPGERFAIPKVQEVPQRLEEAAARMRRIGNFSVAVFDIEGCFPSMPKDAIRAAMQDLVTSQRRLGRKGVWVPRARQKPCSWEAPNHRRNGTWMPLPELNDILGFVLENTYVRMPDGRLLKQTLGIPMGDPLSPGMCIGTAAWMESEWMNGLADIDKCCIDGTRYMDDILLFTSNATWWDQETFLKDFTRSECYWKPLKLEPGKDDTFLESHFFVTPEGTVRYRLKNDNETGTQVWRYHHYRSHVDYSTKRATLLSTLKKVDRMASDSEQRAISARAKCAEFLRLGYPRGIIRYMCAVLARESGHVEWLHTVRNRI